MYTRFSLSSAILKLWTLLFASFFGSSLLCAVTPPHLKAAQELEACVLPENTSYQHEVIDVQWKDRGKNSKCVCHTDCSGFVDALLEYSYGYTKENYERWLGAERPKAKHFYQAIKSGKGFDLMTRIKDIQPGDLLAIKYPPGLRNTGHVMVVDQIPKLLSNPSALYKDAPLEWKVSVIDCSGGHGKEDTRYDEKAHRKGIGKGNIRLYTDTYGDIIGYSWSMSHRSIFYGFSKRPLVAGRLVPGFKP